ncbi:serine protease [Gemmata sp. JC717]|uniref:S1C family serine protease n=1 Tax=Gemmata algarum TaxID=2975278 RepID=UPI0021BAF42A|nr:serine protease [Gemmata algarum]MDY3552419.1 serine protease [Gemmata algarum]
MFRLAAGAALLAGMLLSAAPVAGRADKPSRVEIAKRGKAATAFVDVPGRGTGTAFCIHPSGLFVTNEHVVRGVAGEVTLVLNPSLDTQRVLQAKVVRADKGTDLALLRVVGAKDLPALTLGSAEALAELADVVACGFPLGRALATDRKEYPAISVNAGSVTALRHKDRELQFVQIDVAVTFGNSGGPVLDDNGKVVGVVVGGIGGKSINLAVPVNQLERFLKAPDITFVPPAVPPADLGRPVEFKARVTALVPGAPEPDLKLLLRTGDEKPREFPMKAANGTWAVTAAPQAKMPAARVEVSARFGNGNRGVTGTTDDAVLKVGGRVLRFSSVQRLDAGQTKSKALLADGTTVEGAATGLGLVELDVEGQKFKVDLAKAAQLTFEKLEPAPVIATVVATANGKEIARVESQLTGPAVERPATASGGAAPGGVTASAPLAVAPADPNTVSITPPALDGDKVVKRLPEVFTDVAVGGGGRYLIFQLPKLKKLAVFDVSAARVTRYLPLAEEDITYTAGLDCVVIGLKRAGKLERWSLTTFELEKSGPPPFKEDLKTLFMGCGSNGPLVANGYFLDLATFRQMPFVNSDKSDRIWDPDARVFASGDGTVFGSWNTHYSPSTTTTFVIEGRVVKRYTEGDMMHSIPGPDGKTVFTGKGIASRTLKRGDPDDTSYGYCLPAVRGDYFLSLTTAAGGKGGGFTAYLRGIKQPLARLDRAEHGLSFDGWDRETFGPWKRVFFVPDAKVIAVLPASNDQVLLHKFDADAALEKSGLNYLLVASQPPPEVKAGAPYSYPVKVRAKSTKITYQLDSGPKGMAVSADGLVTWAVPADALGSHEVILSVRDETGQEVFHTFTVRVGK